jgi:hypothetical protein
MLRAQNALVPNALNSSSSQNNLDHRRGLKSTAKKVRKVNALLHQTRGAGYLLENIAPYNFLHRL